jgi:tRNA modification GTPase
MKAWACRTSGVGEAAIALIDVVGPDARSVIEALTGRSLNESPSLRRIGDEVVVTFQPRGWTGEPTVTVSCHGGSAAWQAVMHRLKESGVEPIEPRDLIRRAWERGALDRPQAEAMAYLRSARTLRAARMLSDQLSGALSRDLKAGKTQELLDRSSLGIALTHPRRVVLAGKPNAGKSTLFNALLQRERAIVSPVPGTTRDPVSDCIAIEGVPIELIDTAGVDEAKDALEAEAIRRTQSRMKQADLVLAVAEAGSDDPASGLRVWTKTDLARPGPGPAVCAPRGEGLDELRSAILRELRLDAPETPGQGMIFTPAQAEAIRRDPKGFLVSPPELE